MRNNGFSIAILEVPKVVNIDFIKECYSRAEKIDQFTSDMLVKSFDLPIEDVDISDELEEEDLFKLGTDNLKRRKVSISYLKGAIEFVFLPMLGLSSSINEVENASYLNIKGAMFLVAGGESRYSYPSDVYKYIKAINMSGIV